MPSRILLLRGHHPSVWGLRPFERLPERFDVRLAVTGSPRWSLDGLQLQQVPVRTMRDRLPLATLGAVATLALPDRVLNAREIYAGYDVVHAEELSLWFAAQAARLKSRLGFRLILTVSETIPLLDAYRSPHARRFRAATLAETDLFIAMTQRARDCLLLEGVPEEKIMVSFHGIDTSRFAVPPTATNEHLFISPGRLEWEKGHQDVLRAFAMLKRGIVPAPADAVAAMKLRLVGAGPEQQRLEGHARELGIADSVEIGPVPYEQMPGLYARASAVVLASLPRAGCSLHPADIPRCFWEEQFGVVLAEGMTAGLPLILSTSGAIPEVAGQTATYFAPGDWRAIAEALVAGPLSRPPGARVEHPKELLEAYSVDAAAERAAEAYDRVLGAG
ncbi:MAG: glycosyltransferase family 4 protein [Solirubrobacteraceae bacterium]